MKKIRLIFTILVIFFFSASLFLSYDQFLIQKNETLFIKNFEFDTILVEKLLTNECHRSLRFTNIQASDVDFFANNSLINEYFSKYFHSAKLSIPFKTIRFASGFLELQTSNKILLAHDITAKRIYFHLNMSELGSFIYCYGQIIP